MTVLTSAQQVRVETRDWAAQHGQGSIVANQSLAYCHLDTLLLTHGEHVLGLAESTAMENSSKMLARLFDKMLPPAWSKCGAVPPSQGAFTPADQLERHMRRVNDTKPSECLVTTGLTLQAVTSHLLTSF